MKETIFFSKGEVKQNIISLTIANLVIGLIEFFFSIYLSRILGAQGLGLLSIITPVNCLFLSFMTEGLVVTTSKRSAAFKARSDCDSMEKSITISTVFSFSWSLILSALVISLSTPIATYLLGDKSLCQPIMAVCPLMLLMSLSNIIKGHFLGISKIKIPALINIGEKLLRFPIFYVLVRFFLMSKGMNPVTLVYLCYGLGEVFSVITLFLYYRTIKVPSRQISVCLEDIKAMLPPIVKAATPLCLSQCVLEIMNALSTLVVKSRLCSAGFDVSEALELLGQYKGMVFPLMNYPMIFIGSIAAISVPKVSAFVASGKNLASKKLCQKCLVSSALVGLITFLVFGLFGNDMGILFYKENNLGHMMFLAGLFAPVINCATISQSLVIGLGKEGFAFTNTLLSQCILIICLIVLVGVREININGYLFAVAISNALLLSLNLKIIKET